ncbi:protein of unknown function [Thauera humireducens]|nr:protein of unknown function [Thauera humireducens]
MAVITSSMRPRLASWATASASADPARGGSSSRAPGLGRVLVASFASRESRGLGMGRDGRLGNNPAVVAGMRVRKGQL